MRTGFKVSAFIIVVVVFIAGFAALIPQVESPAPETFEISGDLSGSELASLGEQVFESPEAGCLACHGLGREGLRAPNLANIGAAAEERVAGRSAEQYILESIINPCAYVVQGYDCIMPQTMEQSLGMAKVTALVAFLQSQGGEITVALSADEAQEQPAGGGLGVAGVTAEEIIAELGCAGCHQIDALGAAGQVGPNLSAIGDRLSPDEIRQSILVPDAVISQECPAGPCPAGVMPKNFGERLSGAQLEVVIAFLAGLK